MEYRRKERTQIWHFRHDCPNWPNEFNFLVMHNRPHDSYTCEECIALSSSDRTDTTLASQEKAAVGLSSKVKAAS